MNKIYNCTGHALKIPNVVDSDGIYIFDDRGKRYMDLESGVWCTSVGHGNTRINNRIKQQLDAVTHAGFCYSSNILQEAAESLLSVAGLRNGQCVFLCSGSEAIELARQIAKYVTGKKRSMTLHDSYLGSYSSVKERQENWYVFNWENCRECPDRSDCRRGCAALAEIPKDVSEFIFEPGSSSGFVRFPPESLIRNIVNIVRSGGGKIVVNEVTTGIGRTGKWFGYHHYPIEPDMVAIGKGIGNGYPVSATAIDSNTIKELEHGSFKYMQSHQNDPLGAAIVSEVVNIIKDEELIPKAEINGAKLLKALQELRDDIKIVDVRGRGLMFGLDLCDGETGDRIYERLLNRGYIICNRGGLFRIDPPLTFTQEHMNDFIGAFGEVLKSI